MDANPLVSIVTPSLNQGRFIEEAIESVAAQDYPRIEHIVVDGGSTDGTLDVLHAQPNVRWVSEPDRGQSDALNKGFRMATGELFGWLNADDVYLPSAVTKAVEALTSGPFAMAYGGYVVIRENGSVAFEVAAPPFDYTTLLESKNFVPQPSTFFTRSAYVSAGGVDERYHYGMDYDLWLKIAKNGRVVVIPDTLSAFRFQEGSKSVTQAAGFYPEMRRISRRHGGRWLSPMYLNRLPATHPLAFRALLAYRIVRAGNVRELRRLPARSMGALTRRMRWPGRSRSR
jgi:glycosyltransferase involved in cell wall biosynthesis